MNANDIMEAWFEAQRRGLPWPPPPADIIDLAEWKARRAEREVGDE